MCNFLVAIKRGKDENGIFKYGWNCNIYCVVKMGVFFVITDFPCICL